MKKLLLIRHATAEPEVRFGADFERKLDPTGLIEAKNLGKFIQSKINSPFQICSSSAKRTTETTQYAFEWAKEKEIEFCEQLYNASYQKIIQKIKSVKKGDVLVVVGHNPGISQAATALSAENSYQMSPSSAVCLSFPIQSWDQIDFGKGVEEWYYYP